MEWENELLTTAHKPPPRKGRRAGLNLLNSREDDRPTVEDRSESSTNESHVGKPASHTSSQPMPPPRVRRTGGWANEDSKSSKKRLPSSNVSGLLDRQRFQSLDRTMTSLESDEDIPIIPDLDDFGDEELKPDLSYKVIAAMNCVATYKELEARPSYLKLDNIDLSVLAKCLDIEDYRQIDEDRVLSWDALFTDVASQLHNNAECNDLTDG